MCDPIFIPFFALCNKFFFYMTLIIVNDIRFYDTIIVHIYNIHQISKSFPILNTSNVDVCSRFTI